MAPITFTITGYPGQTCSYVWSNTQQTAERGEAVPLPLVLATFDRYGNVVPHGHAGLYWWPNATSPYVNGTLQDISTDPSDPKTYYRVIMGSQVGSQYLDYNYFDCSIGRNQTGTAGKFTATESPPALLKDLSGSLAGKTGDTLMIDVQALDSHGFGADNATVTFTVTGVDGVLFSYDGVETTSTTQGTSPAGYAIVHYIVGASDNQQVTVTSPGLTSLVIPIRRLP